MMDITVFPGAFQGTVQAIPSKSQAHRMLICAAFADRITTLRCRYTNQDIEATADCLRSLGAVIERTKDAYIVTPIRHYSKNPVLNCRESGSTLRFLLPIVGALGLDATFIMHGRLPERPLSPLWEEMERMGCSLSRSAPNQLHCAGQLRAGSYFIDGNISSQFITGLLFAMALLPGECNLTVNGKLESKPYVDLTLESMAKFGIHISDFRVSGPVEFHSPGALNVEGDWSNAAFFLAARTLGNPLNVTGLNTDSAQGDRAIAKILSSMSGQVTVSASDIPDLIPILAVAAAGKHGGVFTHIQRLRLKESDRVSAVLSMLNAFGVEAEATDDTLRVYPGSFHSCTVDPKNDHRIAMSAAIAALLADGPVTILNAHCVEKSYPAFWEEYRRLGGNYEQYIR